MPRKRAIDPGKGYRIHFNTLQHSDVLPTFAQSHHGTPRQESQWYLNDPDLKDRESRLVRSLDDLLAVMRSGDHDRLSRSVVLFGTHAPLAWKEFFIRPSKGEGMTRFVDLYNRVAKVKGGDPVPCVMLFTANETKTLGRWKEQWIKGRGIQVDGANIDFELYLSYLKEGNPQDVTIRQGQSILVAGMAERSYASASRETVRVYVEREEAMRWLAPKDLVTAPPPRKVLPAPVLRVEDMGSLD